MAAVPSQPKTAQHTFALPALEQHFKKSPNPEGANRLIDLPGNVFLDTEEELNAIAGSLWLMCIKYDALGQEGWAKDKESLRKWITKTRLPVIASLTDKVEPPFHPFTIDQIQRDVAGMTEELLLKTVPNVGEKEVKDSGNGERAKK